MIIDMPFAIQPPPVAGRQNVEHENGPHLFREEAGERTSWL